MTMPSHGTRPADAVREHRVKVADYAVARGDAVLSTAGLGSCIAILLYDAASHVGGLAHVLLPDPSISRDAANRAKFASTAVPLLLEEMRTYGAHGPVTARIAGGASMFAQLLTAGGINMGERNVDAARRALDTAGIPLVGDDTGGDHGRSVYLHVASGGVVVRSLRKGDVVL